jgi:ADP-ribose pyrophosphatase YjhB (NUDIX family)
VYNRLLVGANVVYIMNGSPGQHSISVAGVVIDDQRRALLIRRRDNLHWEPPGGVLERDEPIQAGVCREVKEETGLSVAPLSLSGVYKNMSRGIVSLVFRCKVLGGKLTTNDEVCDFRWATGEEVASLADEAYAVRVLDALEEGGAPAIRQHDGVHLI